MSKNCPERLKTQLSDIFFGYFLAIWSMLLFGDPVQCAPVTMIGFGSKFSLSSSASCDGFLLPMVAIAPTSYRAPKLSNSRRARSLRIRPHERVALIMVGFSLLGQPSRSSTLGERSSFEWKNTHVLGNDS